MWTIRRRQAVPVLPKHACAAAQPGGKTVRSGRCGQTGGGEADRAQASGDSISRTGGRRGEAGGEGRDQNRTAPAAARAASPAIFRASAAIFSSAPATR